MQINDFCDIAAVWALIFVLKNYVKGDNVFAHVPDKVINHFAWASFYEILFEIAISFSFPILVRKYTKFKNFNPLKHGKIKLMENFYLFLLVIINLFTLTMIVLNDFVPRH